MCNKVIYLSLVLVFSFACLAKGSCLEYGHSCWGAHGKRSGGKIYRSIDGSESQHSDGNRDVPLTPDKVKPSELLSILMDRNGRVNLDDAINPHDLSLAKNDNEQMFDSSEQKLRRKLKDAFRKDAYFHYSPRANDYTGLRSTTQASAVRRNQKPFLTAGSSTDYYQIENYPSVNMDMEYLDLK